MLNHLPTATFFMIPLFFNSMGYDYKEISRLRVSIDRSTFIHITTGSPARDDGTAGEFTVIGETIRKQFPATMIYNGVMPCRKLSAHRFLTLIPQILLSAAGAPVPVFSWGRPG